MKKSLMVSFLVMNVLNLCASFKDFDGRSRASSNLSLALKNIEDAKRNAELQAESPISVAGCVCQSPNMRCGLMKAIGAGHYSEAQDLLVAVIADQGYSKDLINQVAEELITARQKNLLESCMSEINSMSKTINELNRMQTPRYKKAKSSIVTIINNSNSSRAEILEAAKKMLDIKFGRDK